ncbi:unnamed protein product [Rotaria sp. Silwood1]|nr:unnamed protein product [Rotaria sp. Silwood1]CAF1585348.1 unnamed protein product [Rotaria sp. Silwood1]CAF3706334.1 unnamed protein product [Rotaria sp. Silwood1]
MFSHVTSVFKKSKTTKSKKTDNESDDHEKLSYDLTNDIKRLEAELDPWIKLSFEPIAMEHQMRAEAFITCCHPIETVDGDKLKRYVNSYGALKEQEKIIEECLKELSEVDLRNCKFDMNKLNESRQSIIDFANGIADKSILTLIDTAIQRQIYIDNIVYNYHSSTPKECHPALRLLWKPYRLLQCEISYRTTLATKLLSLKNYKKFSNEISKPFRQMMSNIYVNLKVALDKIKQSIAAKGKPVANEQIDLDVKFITETLIDYKVLFTDPMILHHEKRAYAYKVCCEKLETDDLIDEYIINFNRDLNKMEKLLRSCLHKQSLSDITNDTLYGGDCQRAYNQLTEVMSERQNSINKYKEQGEDIAEHYRKAIAPKLSQTSIIKSMNTFVKQYCSEQHIFELMFNPENVIKCEKIIRKIIGENGSTIYNVYHTNISTPFRQMILNDWQQLEKAQANNPPISERILLAQLNTQSAPTMVNNARGHKNFTHSRRRSSRKNTASLMMTLIHQNFTIFFMISIHIIFF